MCVLVDTNVYISYLLIPAGDRDPNVIVDGALDGLSVPLVVPELTAKIRRKVHDKRYLADRISPEAVDRFLASLHVIAETLPHLDDIPRAIGRDRKDDDLFAHATVAQADLIVSGDEDVISLGEVGGIRILSTAEFARLLRAMDLT